MQGGDISGRKDKVLFTEHIAEQHIFYFVFSTHLLTESIPWPYKTGFMMPNLQMRSLRLKK
jgi:hypothetical protein